MKLWLWSLAIFVLFPIADALSQVAPPAQTPTDVLRSSQKGVNDIEQLRTALHSPDPSVRMSTFTAMVESNNAALTTIAINEAHASQDVSLRDLSVRAALRELRSFALEPTSELNPEAQNFYVIFTPNFHPEITKYDWQQGIFTLNNGLGQVSASRLTFRSGYCQANMTAIEGTWAYEGMVICLNGSYKLMTRMRTSLR